MLCLLHRDKQPQLQRNYWQRAAHHIAVLSSCLHNLQEWRFSSSTGGTLQTAADTYRSRGVPWLLSLWVVTGDHIATACLRNPELLDSPDVGSHCEQSAPIAYESVCRKKIPNSGKAEDISAKIPFFQEQELRQMSASESGHCHTERAAALQHVSTWRHSHHSPAHPQGSSSEWIYRPKITASALMSSTLVPCGFGMCHIKQLYEGKRYVNATLSSNWFSAL